MPEVVRRFVTEIVENEALLEKYADSAPRRGSLRDRIEINGKNQLLSVEQFTRDSVEELFSLADIMQPIARRDRKSTRLNSSHVAISYAVFCLKKKNTRL